MLLALRQHRITLLLVVISAVSLLPLFAFAQIAPSCSGDSCGFNDLLLLVSNIIDFIIKIAMPVAAVLFAYAGFLYITDGGSRAKVAKAHAIFRDVFIGFIIVLGAWLIVKLIVTVFVNPDNLNLDRFIQ